MKQREIGYLMQVAPEDRDEFVEILNELVEEGSIEVSKRGKYMPPSVDVYKRQSLHTSLSTSSARRSILDDCSATFGKIAS